MSTKNLLLILSAPAKRLPDGRVRLDIKFLEGLKKHKQHWPPPARCLLWETGAEIPFGRDCSEADLAMPVDILASDARLQTEHLKDAEIILAAADNWRTHDLRTVANDDVAIVYAVENTLKNRLDILRLDPKNGPLRKLRSALWLVGTEKKMRKALASAAALQCNGFPAYRAYGNLAPDAIVYMDGRMTDRDFASEAEQNQRRRRLLAGHPLRLVNFGRLEPLKGAQDFLPFAQALKARGVSFSFNIFGSGSLEGEIRAKIAAFGLSDCVTLNPPVDFEKELVPWMRENADIFLSCHRQSDPSCAYIEAMGCGLAVLGYHNAMLQELLQRSAGGWSVPLGKISTLAAKAASISSKEIAEASSNALSYARQHDFEKEFALRMDQLRKVSGA